MFSILFQKGHRCGTRFAVNTRVDCLDLGPVSVQAAGGGKDIWVSPLTAAAAAPPAYRDSARSEEEAMWSGRHAGSAG